MKQEDKELLLRDLSARLTYSVKCEIDDIDEPLELESIKFKGDYFIFGNGIYERYITEIKPYLRPMSSMTEEERKEWYATFESVYDLVPGGDPYNEDDYDDNWHEEPGIESFDWLNAHHFDCRGLIDKGLALEAPKGMYK